MKSKQITFSDIEYGNRKRITKREEFLARPRGKSALLRVILRIWSGKPWKTDVFCGIICHS